MEESESESESGFSFLPSRVALTPFTPIPAPSSRRLSSSFYQPSRPLSSARKLAYVSLQGRLVNAEEVTSARTIRGGLSRDQAIAWEMFTPIQRVVLVAVIGAAVSESKKNIIISNLKKSIELRDQVLSSMQQKLDSLCEQVDNTKDQQGSGAIISDAKDSGFPFDASFKSNGMDFVDCGCWLCDQHHERLYGLVSHSLTKDLGSDMMNFVDEAEPEERRMSDLSDWACSVTSSGEIQVSGLALEQEQDITSLKKECEEKDATIRELTSFLQTSDTASSKRLSELEDIIRRKNMIITKLKKDMVVLEQKVVQLTRLRRTSSSCSSIDANIRQLPVMAENLLYDMDSTTSPSSSDSDSSPVSRQMATIIKIQETPKEKNDDTLCKEMATMTNNLETLKEKNDNTLRRDQFSSPKKGSKMRHTNKYTESRYDSPLKEISMNQKSSKISYARPRQCSSNGGDSNRNKRHLHSGSRGFTSMKRWS